MHHKGGSLCPSAAGNQINVSEWQARKKSLRLPYHLPCRNADLGLSADLKSCNRRARNDKLNRAVQSFLYTALQDEHEGAAKKSLAVLTELYRRQVWRDARTVNVIGEPILLCTC